jgi:hypothetical protein
MAAARRRWAAAGSPRTYPHTASPIGDPGRTVEGPRRRARPQSCDASRPQKRERLLRCRQGRSTSPATTRPSTASAGGYPGAGWRPRRRHHAQGRRRRDRVEAELRRGARADGPGGSRRRQLPQAARRAGRGPRWHLLGRARLARRPRPLQPGGAIALERRTTTRPTHSQLGLRQRQVCAITSTTVITASATPPTVNSATMRNRSGLWPPVRSADSSSRWRCAPTIASPTARDA